MMHHHITLDISSHVKIAFISTHVTQVRTSSSKENQKVVAVAKILKSRGRDLKVDRDEASLNQETQERRCRFMNCSFQF